MVEMYEDIRNEPIVRSAFIQKIKQSDWKEIINLGNEDMFEKIYEYANDVSYTDKDIVSKQ